MALLTGACASSKAAREAERARFAELQRQQKTQEADRQRAWREAAARQAEAQSQYEAARRACFVALYDEKADPQYRADCAMAIENERRAREEANQRQAMELQRHQIEMQAHSEAARAAAQQQADRERRAAAFRAIGNSFSQPSQPAPAYTPPRRMECKPNLGGDKLVCNER